MCIRDSYRTLFYLPSVIGSSVAVAVLWKWIFNSDSGLMNYLISFTTGIPISECPKWLASEVWSKPALVIVSLWGVGGGMIIYLAGLQGLSLIHIYYVFLPQTLLMQTAY